MALKLFLSRWIRGIKRSSSANLPTNIYSSALNNLHYTLTFTALWTACQPSRHTHALASIRREGRSSEEMKWRTPRRLFSLWRKTPSFHANLATEVIFAFHCLFSPQHPKQTDLWPLAIFLWPRGTLAALKPKFPKVPKVDSEPARKDTKCLQTLSVWTLTFSASGTSQSVHPPSVEVCKWKCLILFVPKMMKGLVCCLWPLFSSFKTSHCEDQGLIIASIHRIKGWEKEFRRWTRTVSGLRAIQSQLLTPVCSNSQEPSVLSGGIKPVSSKGDPQEQGAPLGTPGTASQQQRSHQSKAELGSNRCQQWHNNQQGFS